MQAMPSFNLSDIQKFKWGEYRHKVKTAFIEHLMRNGYKQNHPFSNVFESTFGYSEKKKIVFTLHPSYVEKYERYFPIKDGWSTRQYKYTYAAIEKIQVR